jgi:hypothetical protein
MLLGCPKIALSSSVSLILLGKKKKAKKTLEYEKKDCPGLN